MVKPLWKTIWKFLKNLKIDLPYGPAIPLLGIYLEKIEALIQKDICILMFMVALFSIAKTWHFRGDKPRRERCLAPS